MIAGELVLPHLSLPAVATMQDALAQAAVERKGVVAVGDKGVGKSVALRCAVMEFDEAERKLAAQNSSYHRRRVFTIRTIRGPRYRDLLTTLYYEVADSEWHDRVRGQRKTDDTLRDELLTALEESGAVVIVIDEAETLSADNITAVRDLLADGQARALERHRGDGLIAAGVGVLLVGVDANLTARLRATDEVGQRFVRCHEVVPLSARLACEVYEAYLPACAALARSVGTRRWRQIIKALTERHPVPVRAIENHVRRYVHLAAERAAQRTGAPVSVASIAFIPELFVATWAEAGWLSPATATSCLTKILTVLQTPPDAAPAPDNELAHGGD